MKRLVGLIVTGLTLWACGESLIDGPPPLEKQPPDVAALYEGVWRVEVSEHVQLAQVCVGYSTSNIEGETSECPSSVTIGTQTGAAFEGDFLIRVSPDFIGWFDDVWGTLTGTVDTTGDVTIAVSVVDGGVNAFEDLTGCTGSDGDSAFSGTVNSDTLRFSATFVSRCVSAIDSSLVPAQWTMEFTGVASPLHVGSAAVTVNPASVTIQSGSSMQLTVTVEDDSGFVLTDPLVAWSSADTAIARVTPDGVVSVVEVGTAAITAAAAGQSATASVTVSGWAFTSVSAGWEACGVAGNDAACWGTNLRLPPVIVPGGFMFQSVSAGHWRHHCGVIAGGTARCWGDGERGQLGDGSTVDRETPTLVSGIADVAMVSVGSMHSCGLASQGAAYCWGDNEWGQLGNGSTTLSATPVQVSGSSSFVALSAGAGHTCALTADGSAHCWGLNSYGQVGDNSTTARTTPTAVSGGIGFAAVSAGGSHTCGLTAGGVAYCWGYNEWGQLGDGTRTDRTTPTAVSGDPRFVAISAGDLHTCGLTADGIAYCWGYNGNGEVGDGAIGLRTSPVQVVGGISFGSVGAGSYRTCGLSDDGIVYCWGGYGPSYSYTTPVRVPGQP